MTTAIRSWACLALIISPVVPVRAADVQFSRDVVPVLTKAGCNAGSCHGSFQGRGGFRLSLLGFDPHMDYDALVREARGRRILASAPAHSLILRKPTGAMAHGGGKRLTVDSAAYRILHDWITSGLPGPRTDDPRVVRLEVTPAEATLRPDQQANLKVQAVWSDGHRQDATAWALFETVNEPVAEVSAAGVVKALHAGRATITIRYLGQVAAVPITVPFVQTETARKPGRNNFVDDFILAEWKKVGMQPAPPASDAEFIRRVYLDLIGTLPTPEEVRRFLNSKEDNKRGRLIDSLLERPEYVDYWALKWSDLLRAHRRTLGEKGLHSFGGWLRQNLRENRPIDQFVRELLTAQGNLYTSGPVAFYYVDQTPEELAETTAQLFLGIRLQCAKCHHHPYEVWGQDDYYGLAAFFSRIQRKDTKEQGRYGGAQSVRLAAEGKLIHPVTGLEQPPRVLGQAPPATDSNDPRQGLAQWVTQKDNPYFARNIVNRYWGYLFGRGLVEPIDDLRSTNPATHPGLLDALAGDFVQQGYDLKHLLRTLCNSSAYQLAGEVAPQRDTDGMFFTHRRPRRLSAEVLLDAINQAAGTRESFDENGRGRFGVANVLPGTRAIALPDPTVVSYFLDTFGRPKRTSTCECERSSQPDLSQVLHLINNDKIHEKVISSGSRVANLLKEKKSDAEIVDELYLAALARLPSARESEQIRQLLAESPSRKEGFEDLLWTLLNMAEFACNH